MMLSFFPGPLEISELFKGKGEKGLGGLNPHGFQAV